MQVLQTHSFKKAATLPYLKKEIRANIINISSIWGVEYNPSLISYSSSKFAVEGYTGGLRLWRMPQNIRVCSIQVDKVNTDFRRNFKGFPEIPPENLAKMLHPDDIASAVNFILSSSNTAQISSIRLDAPLWYQVIRIYPMKITPRIALVLTLVGTFFWGSNFQATKIALTTVSPWTASFERFLIAVIVIFLIMIFKEGLRWHVLSQNFISYIFLGIIGVAGFNGALFVGLQTSNPITASLIMATTPISANIIEAIMNKSFPTYERVIGMLISMFGVYLVITNGRFLSNHVSFAKGDIMILLGSIGWAFYTVGTRSFVKNATPLETTSWTMLSGTVALGVLTFLFESPLQETMSMSGASLFALLWIGVAGSVLAYLFWNIGIAIRGPGKTAIFFNFVPISALLVQILFGFIPQIMQIIGVFVTIFGVLIGQGYIFSLLGSRKAVPNAHKE